MIHDLRFAFRALARSPWFAVASIGMLAFGIGLSVAMVGTVSGVLLRGLPFPGSDRLVMLNAGSATQHVERANITAVEARQLASGTTAFDALAYFTYWSDTVETDGQRPRDVTTQKVSADFFRALGMKPLIGRVLDAHDVQENRALAVISFEEWQRSFGGDANVIGRMLHIVGTAPTQVIGVMPKAFEVFAGDTGIWRPFSEADVPTDGARQLNQRYLLMVGRLNDGVSMPQATAVLDAQSAAIRTMHGLTQSDWKFEPQSMLDLLVGHVRPALYGALTLAVLILLIAAANVAILVDGRQTARRHQQAVMQAIGASRRRIWRQLLAELLVIAGIASTLGIAIAWFGIYVLREFARGNVPRVDAITLDWSVLAIALLLGLAMPLVALVSGALRVNADASEAIRGGARNLLGQRRQRRLLPAVAMALSTVSLIASLGFAAVLWQLQHVDPGFSASRIHALQIFRGTPPTEWNTFAERVQTQLSAIPGVSDVALTSSAPLSVIGPNRIDLQVVGRSEAEPMQVAFRRVSSGYRELLDIPLLAGRDFSDGDRAGSEPVAIINHAVAKSLFGDAPPLGQQVNLPLNSGELVSYRIVGVVGNIRNDGLRMPASPEVLVPFAQAPHVAMTFLVRGDRDIAGIDRQMADALGAIDPEQAITRQFALADDLAAELAPARFFARTVGGFAVAALLLAMLGVYAVASLQQQRRVGEFGLRLAIGASPTALALAIVRDSIKGSAVGVGCGLLAAALALRLLQSQWSDIEQVSQWLLIVWGLLAMTFAAVLSALLPAWRAARLHPMVALRNE